MCDSISVSRQRNHRKVASQATRIEDLRAKIHFNTKEKKNLLLSTLIFQDDYEEMKRQAAAIAERDSAIDQGRRDYNQQNGANLCEIIFNIYLDI